MGNDQDSSKIAYLFKEISQLHIDGKIKDFSIAMYSLEDVFSLFMNGGDESKQFEKILDCASEEVSYASSIL